MKKSNIILAATMGLITGVACSVAYKSMKELKEVKHNTSKVLSRLFDLFVVEHADAYDECVLEHSTIAAVRANTVSDIYGEFVRRNESQLKELGVYDNAFDTELPKVAEVVYTESGVVLKFEEELK